MDKLKPVLQWISKNWSYFFVIASVILVYSIMSREKVASEEALKAALATNKVVLEAQQKELKKVQELVQKAKEERVERDHVIQKEIEYHRETLIKEVAVRVKISNEKKPDELARDFAKSFGAEYVKINED